MSIKACDDFRTSRLIGTDDFSVLFRIELARESSGIHQVAEHDGELAPFRVRWGGGNRWRRDLPEGRRECVRRRGWRCGSRACLAGPDQNIPPLVHGQALALDEFVLQIIQGRVVELKLPLQGAVGQAPPALEHGYRLVEDLLKGHRPPSLYRCGVQKIAWEWAQPFGHIYTA